MPTNPPPASRFLSFVFISLCLCTFIALLYFAQSAATQATPAYSTWNTTPTGAKLLYDGLTESKIVQVSRQFKPVNLQKPINATVFFLDTEAYLLDREDNDYFNLMETTASQGNNLVLAFTNTLIFRFKNQPEKGLLQTRWGINANKDGLTVDKTWHLLANQTEVWQRPFGPGVITLIEKGQRLSNKSIATNPADRQLLISSSLSAPTPSSKKPISAFGNPVASSASPATITSRDSCSASSSSQPFSSGAAPSASRRLHPPRRNPSSPPTPVPC